MYIYIYIYAYIYIYIERERDIYVCMIVLYFLPAGRPAAESLFPPRPPTAQALPILYYTRLYYAMLCYTILYYNIIYYTMTWYDMIWYDIMILWYCDVMIWYGAMYFKGSTTTSITMSHTNYMVSYTIHNTIVIVTMSFISMIIVIVIITIIVSITHYHYYDSLNWGATACLTLLV